MKRAIITSSTNLTDEEIDKMMKEAEANKEADEKRKEEVEVKNDADSLIFQTEKAIKDLGDKIDSKDKEEAEDKIKDLRKAMEDDDIDEIKKLKDELQEKAMSLATKVYEEAAKNREADNDSSSKDDDDDKHDNVQEASYEEK